MTNAEKVFRMPFTLRGELIKPAKARARTLRRSFSDYVGELVEIDLERGIIPYPPGKGPNSAGARKGDNNEDGLDKALLEAAEAGSGPVPDVKKQPKLPAYRRV